MTTSSNNVETPGIDPRGPRFGAGITAILLLAVLVRAFSYGDIAPTLAERVMREDFLLLLALNLLFAWGAFAGVTRHPWASVYAALVKPRLKPPSFLEHPTPPTFAQGVGFLITGVGLLLHLAGVDLALIIAAGMAFVAAFLNAAFGLCLGCEMYALLARFRKAPN
jgi:hypothetical protein